MAFRSLYVLAACTLLLACQPDSGAGAGQNTPHAPVDAPATDPGLDQDVVVSTNEPFWQARVEGDAVIVSGIDAPERRFGDARTAMTADGLRIDASDADGEIIVIVRRMGCEDDMSGARFPMTGLLTIDGQGPFRGCARPASMPRPAPPEESTAGAAGSSVPARFVGRWNVDPAACRTGAGDGGLAVAPDALDFHESVADVMSVDAVGTEAVRVTLRFQGEGEVWTDHRVLRLDHAGALVVEDREGQGLKRVRCDG